MSADPVDLFCPYCGTSESQHRPGGIAERCPVDCGLFEMAAKYLRDTGVLASTDGSAP